MGSPDVLADQTGKASGGGLTVSAGSRVKMLDALNAVRRLLGRSELKLRSEAPFGRTP